MRGRLAKSNSTLLDFNGSCDCDCRSDGFGSFSASQLLYTRLGGVCGDSVRVCFHAHDDTDTASTWDTDTAAHKPQLSSHLQPPQSRLPIRWEGH